MSPVNQNVTFAQLAEHDKQKSLWIAVHGQVYDLASFVTVHPGGSEVLVDCAGTDGTEAFEYAGHSELNRKKLQHYWVGQLVGEESRSQTYISESSPPVVKPKSTTRVMPNVGWSSLSRKIVTLSTILVIPLTGVLAYKLYETMGRIFPITSNLGLSFLQIPSSGHPFWNGVAAASCMTCVGLGYLYKLFLSTLDYQNDVSSFPPTIPRKLKR